MSRKLSRLAGVKAGARWRNPERSGGAQDLITNKILVGAIGFEPTTPCAQVEPFSGRERSGSPLAKS